MMEIKNLEERTSSTKIYNKVQEIVDKSTGQVTTVVNSFLQRERAKDNFVKIFTENIDFLAINISSSALKVVIVMVKYLNYQNIFKYDSDFIEYFTSHNILSKSSVYRAIKELKDKNVIFYLNSSQRKQLNIMGKGSFIVNPQIFGKGSFKDIRRLRLNMLKVFEN